MEEDSQRDGVVVLEEAGAAEPPTDDSGTMVRMAAAPFGTYHPPLVSFGPLAPRRRLPSALLSHGTSLPTLGHDHTSAQHCPRGCPLLAVVPPVGAQASWLPQGEILKTTLKSLDLWYFVTEMRVIAAVFVAHNPSPARFIELNNSSPTATWDCAISVHLQEATALSWFPFQESFCPSCFGTGWRQENTQSSGRFLACLAGWPDQLL